MEEGQKGIETTLKMVPLTNIKNNRTVIDFSI